MQIDNLIQINDWKIKNFLKVILAIQLAVWGAIGLDAIGLQIPIIRQLVGFIYLTFVPGIIILRILKLHKLGNIETVLCTIGLSIATLMFTGVVMNTIYPYIGISKPISITPLIITISVVILFLCVLSYVRDKDFSDLCYIDIKDMLSPPVLFLCLIPFMVVLGTYLVNFHHNNILLMLMIIMIALIALLIGFDKFFPKNLYPLVIITIGVSLLLHTSLISSYIVGGDIHVEYYFAKLVGESGYWDSTRFHAVNAMLSVTILPTIYSTLLNVDLPWIFKTIYPILYSFVPLGLYQIYQQQTGKKTAFLSVFFFMSITTFYGEMIGLARQQIAEIFFMLLLLLIVNEKNDLFKRKLLFIIFSVGMIVSHYGLSSFCLYLFLFALLVLSITQYKSKILTPDMIMIFFAVLFVWYTYIAKSYTFTAIINAGYTTYISMVTDLLNPHSNQAIGYIAKESISPFHNITRVLHLITQFFITVGVFNLLIKHKKKNFSREYMSFSIISMLLLLSCLVIPRVSGLLNIGRTYHITLFFLAPFCIFGAETLLSLISKILKFMALCHTKFECMNRKVISCFLILFFLFNVGFVYEITGAPQTSISLSGGNKYQSLQSYTPAEISGAAWLKKYHVKGFRIYGSAGYGNLLLMNFCEGYFGGGNLKGLRANSEIKPLSYLYLDTSITKENFILSKRWMCVNFDDSKVYFELKNCCKIYYAEDSIIFLKDSN